MDRSFDWTRMRAFLATAQTGSYSAAARALGLTQPTLGRQVAALEEELGVILFERAGRGMQLTEAGQDLIRDAAAMDAAAQRIALVAAARAQSLEGRITVTASDMMSAYVLPEALRALREIAPRLRVDVLAANDVRDILAREADIAIRHVRPSEPDLIAKLVADAPAYLYAGRRYVEARGVPERVEDLIHHDFVSMGNDRMMVEAMAARGLPVDPARFQTGSNSGITVWELVRQGFGLFPMSAAIGDRDPDMVRVLEDGPAITFPVWLVTHRDLHTSRRIRLVFDYLAELLAPQSAP